MVVLGTHQDRSAQLAALVLTHAGPVNLLFCLQGVFLCCQAAAKQMVEQVCRVAL